jgi:hypothetical protein
MKVFERLDRWAGRFNRWFGATGVAAGVEQANPGGGPPVIDPLAVSVVIGEIERRDDEPVAEPPDD